MLETFKELEEAGGVSGVGEGGAGAGGGPRSKAKGISVMLRTLALSLQGSH